MDFRIGHGFDVHKFEAPKEQAHIFLCGVKIDCFAPLIAHSDGDVALHALCDALLGSLALGDIGFHFPDTDDSYKNADSRELLSNVYNLIKDKGYFLHNADITILAQTPKIAPHVMAMRQSIADVLKCDISQISVKATTTEKLGFTGRKEGIAVEAVVMVKA
ncbi:MAG: 2-C-methyl-D-erythritol 2,4-cyclodiphosphate synthase [Saccharospirillaceae bacterium]|nr:2-C-methyl-D-erythritol 2,4-cyclodiphosphate synthase [Pseudomonadales bacterium]NRB81704.1 2-C-methyl-D-erythritol 2,4-cyclodiphosphate synthase [Saccharospirillaceae bacterium]